MRSSPRSASLVVLFYAVNLGACATFATGETKLEAVKTIGIISALGDEMSVSKAGLTGLNNPGQNLSISSWGLDELFIRQATATLSKRFQVQPVNYPRTAFMAIKDSPVTAVNFVRTDPAKKLLQTEVSPRGLDAYVVITKAKSNFGSASRKVEGIGFVTYGTLLASYNQVYTLYEIRVFDGKTFDVIEKRTAAPLDNSGAMKLEGPSLVVDDTLTPNTSDPAQNEKLHAAILDLVTRSLSSTLSDMHLSDAI